AMMPFGAAAPRLTRENAVRTTVEVPNTVPLVALTVLVNVPAVVPPVNNPVMLLIVPPPFATDQTGEIGNTLPLASRPTAEYCCVPLVVMVFGFGVTVMVA